MLVDKLIKSPLVPVYYNADIDSCKSVLRDCYAGGVRVFEFVDRGAHAKENFKALLSFRDTYFADMTLGVGTIKNEIQAKEYIALGADFLVSPIVNSAIAAIVQSSTIEWIPGCMTPSEIAFAESLGATTVKLFPGDVLGPNFIKAIKPLFPSLHFMVTGGVSLTADNLRLWFNAGATAVGIGSKLFEGEFLADDKDMVANLKAGLAFIKTLQ